MAMEKPGGREDVQTSEYIRNSVDELIEALVENPEKGRGPDTPATATIEDDLRFRVEGPGNAAVVTDMVETVGGGGSAPSPGWLFRAALASCDATMIAIRAAQQGVQLTTLEVTVEGESDARGMLAIDDAVPAGPRALTTRVRVAADGVSTEQLEEIVEWAVEHSPVADAVHRTVPNDIQLDIN